VRRGRKATGLLLGGGSRAAEQRGEAQCHTKTLTVPKVRPTNTPLINKLIQAPKSLVTGAHERFLQLPVVVVLAGLWLAGIAFISLFGLAFYVLIYLLGIVSGA
jgi:hypothetical protein